MTPTQYSRCWRIPRMPRRKPRSSSDAGGATGRYSTCDAMRLAANSRPRSLAMESAPNSMTMPYAGPCAGHLTFQARPRYGSVSPGSIRYAAGLRSTTSAPCRELSRDPLRVLAGISEDLRRIVRNANAPGQPCSPHLLPRLIAPAHFPCGSRSVSNRPRRLRPPSVRLELALEVVLLQAPTID